MRGSLDFNTWNDTGFIVGFVVIGVVVTGVCVVGVVFVQLTTLNSIITAIRNANNFFILDTSLNNLTSYYYNV